MPLAMVARILLAAAAASAFSAGAGAWWDPCHCDAEHLDHYGPAPAYVYDHSRGPTWTGNGWAYLPIGVYYPRADAHTRHAGHPYRGGHPRHGYRRGR